MFKKIIIKLTIICMFIIFVINTTLLYEVSGGSMEDTFKNNDWVLINKAYFNINREDVIITKWKDNLLIKRVIGTDKDKIEIKDNELYLNDSIKTEKYIKEKMNNKNLSVIVPDDKIFIMGDNRNNSIDSRKELIGCINKGNVIGKVIFNFGYKGYIKFIIVILIFCTIIWNISNIFFLNKKRLS